MTARALDRMISRRFGLRAESTEYTVNRHDRIPMRDGVELLADHSRPSGARRQLIQSLDLN